MACECTTAQCNVRYCQGVFQGSCIKMSVEADPATLEKEYRPSFRCHNFKAAFDYILRYPLLMAVARCSMVVPRHRPCVITLVCGPHDLHRNIIWRVFSFCNALPAGMSLRAK